MEIIDKNGRVLLCFDDNGNLAISRHKDTDEKTKEFIMKVIKELSDLDPKKVRKFLDFEVEDFCS